MRGIKSPNNYNYLNKLHLEKVSALNLVVASLQAIIYFVISFKNVADKQIYANNANNAGQSLHTSLPG